MHFVIRKYYFKIGLQQIFDLFGYSLEFWYFNSKSIFGIHLLMCYEIYSWK